MTFFGEELTKMCYYNVFKVDQNQRNALLGLNDVCLINIDSVYQGGCFIHALIYAIQIIVISMNEIRRWLSSQCQNRASVKRS